MIPFQQMGKGVTFTGATSAPSAVQCVSDNNVNCQQYTVVNTSADTSVFIGVGAGAQQATDRAVIPTGTPAYGYCVPPNKRVVLTGPANAWFTGITAASSAIVYVYPGFER